MENTYKTEPEVKFNILKTEQMVRKSVTPFLESIADSVLGQPGTLSELSDIVKNISKCDRYKILVQTYCVKNIGQSIRVASNEYCLLPRVKITGFAIYFFTSL